jgi:hypothetical protein
LLGLPVDVADAHFQMVFEDALEHTFFGFNGTYLAPDPPVFDHGKGYWVRLDQASTVTQFGIPVTTLVLNLVEGWNLVSGPVCNVSLVNVSDPGGILVDGTLYGYDGAYLQADTFIPGQGYWLRASTSGQITLSCTTASLVSRKHDPRSNIGLEDFGLLIVNDSTAHSRTLYFGGILPEEMSPLHYSLPPLAPGKSFDVRFENGSTLAEATHFETEMGIELLVQSTNFPIRLHVERMPLFQGHVVQLDEFLSRRGHSWQYELQVLSGNEVVDRYTLSVGQEVKLRNPSINRLRLRRIKDDLPQRFELYPNYPNPFNPSTTIRYALPTQVQVQLDIYDVLGRRVTTLVDGEQKPGYYSVVWKGITASGIQAASGVYFYVMWAGNYRNVHQMMLVK